MAHRLTEGFFWHLKEGVLFPLLEWVRADQSLSLEIREDYVEIYYRGTKLLKVSPASICYQVCLAPNWSGADAGAAAQGMPDARLGSLSDVKEWVAMGPTLKSTIDLYLNGHPKEDHEPQQVVQRANNFAGVGLTTDYYVCDIDYETAEGRLGLVAVHWPAAAGVVKKPQRRRLAFVVAEHAEVAITAPGGVHDHIAHINHFLGDAGRVRSLQDEMVGVFNQKRALGLLDCDGDLDGFSDEQPLLILALVDRKDDRPSPRTLLESLPPSPRAELHFAACPDMQCGLLDAGVVGLEKARARIHDAADVAEPTRAEAAPVPEFGAHVGDDARHADVAVEPSGGAGQEPPPAAEGGRKTDPPTTARTAANARLDRILGVVVNQLPALVGIVLVAYGICARSQRLVPEETYFDEGILLSNAHFVLHGLWPYRDFYSNYPPGIFLLLAAVWKVFGVSAWAYRLVGIAIHLALALLAGRLAGRIGGRHFSWLAMGMVVVWTPVLGLIPFAWVAGVACAFAFVELWARANHDPTRGRHLLAGVAYGLVGCFRHDLFVYLTFTLGLCWLVPRVLRWRLGYVRPGPRELGWLVAGAAVPLCLVWLPPLALAGLRTPLRDLLIEQVLYVEPGSLAKMPPLTGLDRATGWPEFLASEHVGACVQILLAPLFALYLLTARPRLRGISGMTVLPLGALSLAVMPQMLKRSDLWHVIQSVAPALILSSALLEAVSRSVRPLATRIAVCAALLFVVIRPVQLEFLPRRHLLTTGMVGSPEAHASRQPGFFGPDPSLDAQRRAVFEYIEKHTTARERVMFANSQHERTMVNETDLYFLADRLPGTRYTQYSPNMTSRREIQEEMIASLERHAVRVVVLSSLFDGYLEDQPVLVLKGSTLLDEYLRNRFVPTAHFGVYTILERRP